jgi:hypothetical protein
MFTQLLNIHVERDLFAHVLHQLIKEAEYSLRKISLLPLFGKLQIKL